MVWEKTGRKWYRGQCAYSQVDLKTVPTNNQTKLTCWCISPDLLAGSHSYDHLSSLTRYLCWLHLLLVLLLACPLFHSANLMGPFLSSPVPCGQILLLFCPCLFPFRLQLELHASPVSVNGTPTPSQHLHGPTPSTHDGALPHTCSIFKWFCRSRGMRAKFLVLTFKLFTALATLFSFPLRQLWGPLAHLFLFFLIPAGPSALKSKALFPLHLLIPSSNTPLLLSA